MELENKDIRIVILHRGFVYVGRFRQDDSKCALQNAYNVRRWGTSEGLGQLAFQGPLQNTQLDACGTVRFHELAVIATIDCDVEKWDHVLV